MVVQFERSRKARVIDLPAAGEGAVGVHPRAAPAQHEVLAVQDLLKCAVGHPLEEPADGHAEVLTMAVHDHGVGDGFVGAECGAEGEDQLIGGGVADVWRWVGRTGMGHEVFFAKGGWGITPCSWECGACIGSIHCDMRCACAAACPGALLYAVPRASIQHTPQRHGGARSSV